MRRVARGRGLSSWWQRSTAPRTSRVAAVEALNANDVVIVQHEYGMYDGPDGDSMLDLMAAIDVPIVVVAHTVLSEPTPNQRSVLEQVCAARRHDRGHDRDGATAAVSRASMSTAPRWSLIPHGATVAVSGPDDSVARAG